MWDDQSQAEMGRSGADTNGFENRYHLRLVIIILGSGSGNRSTSTRHRHYRFFVLGSFSAAEETVLKDVLPKAASAMNMLTNDSIDTVMNRYNK